MMPRNIEVKICGLTNFEDAKAALDFGADYVGFVTYEKSPRSITLTQLRRIQERLPEHKRSIGIFVNESREKVLRVATDCGLYAVQIHGHEPPEEFADMLLPVWRVICFQDGTSHPKPEKWQAERYLIDSTSQGKYGGSGLPANWSLAAVFSLKWPTMLAGGLNVNNIQAAIRQVNPLGVDAASGIELSPGKKDHEKMEQFIRLAKGIPPEDNLGESR